VTSSSLPSAPGPKDSEPAPPPTQPPGDAALWDETDIAAARGPAAAFPTNAKNAPSEQMPTIGHIGRYALKYRLGEGGLGTVYAAHDPLLSRLIAVKTLNVELDPNERESFNRLFLNEARAAAGLSHPHIVTVFDAGVSDDRAYIAMELLKGRDLRQLRQEGWRPTPSQAALIVRRVADALAYAHSKGVVHRDVKPANIFMVGRTQPRVLDFGIARIAHQHDGAGAGDVAAGSPYYLAPEQARQETVDRRADVFSLGVVLYELLTDRKPFRGNTLEEIAAAVQTHEPPLAHTVDPDVPEALARIAARAMEKNPEHRYRSARAFSRELRHWLEENAVASEAEAEQQAAARQRWKRRAVVGIAAALLAGIALTAALGGLSSRRGAAPPAADPAVAAKTDASTASPVSAQAPAAETAAAATAANTAAAAATANAVPAAAPATPAPVPDTALARARAPVATPVAGTNVAPAASATLPAAASAAPSTTPTAVAAKPATPAPTMPDPATATPATVRAAPPSSAAPATASAKATPPAAPTAKSAGVHAAATSATKPPTKESPKERRAREAREREARARLAAAAVPAPTGVLRIAVSPWGQVEVDGRPAGTSPPLTELTLSEGAHQIVIRNADLPPYSASVSVTAGQTATLKHRF
jgi:serine/threonine-protein kinase